MHVTAILLAAGRGLRLGSKTPKPLINLGRLPIITYSLIKLSRSPWVKDIVLVVNPKNSKGITREIAKRRIKKIKCMVLGGRRRQDSVAHGLSLIYPRTDLVLIHDAARPFFDKNIIPKLLRQAKETGAAILGVPVKATVKRVHSTEHREQSTENRAQRRAVVAETLDRDELWEIQTPQVFKRDLILKAYRRLARVEVTDDSALVEKLGVKVSLVRGPYFNIKITTPEDLIIAKALLKYHQW